MPETLTPAEARRIFLHAQGLARKRPNRRVGDAQFRAYLQQQGVLQLDSVSVFARAHYMPLFSRFGPYDPDALDAYLWSSGETFEHWGHEASVMPLDLLPHLRHRMDEQGTRWRRYVQDKLERSKPGIVKHVEAAVHEAGPLTAADLSHLEDGAPGRRGGWWNLSDTKLALEYLFLTGRAAVAGRPNFQRLYDAPHRVWGEAHEQPAPPVPEAQQRLFDVALASAGIGTVADLADHFRIKKTPAKRLAASSVERGLARWVRVQGWKEPALLAADARDPGRATGAALLSPFDPACRFRDRLERMFGMEYRIEIYTPARKRRYGYYTLPFLLGDQMVGRVDLKSDRKASALVAKASWLEERPAPAAKQRNPDEVAAALAAELRTAAAWHGLDDVVVEPVGNLAPALAHAVSDTAAPTRAGTRARTGSRRTASTSASAGTRAGDRSEE